MERVGDMTRNHLVGNNNADIPRSDEADKEEGSADSILLDETPDPKQQSVASFFTAKAAPKVGKKAQPKKIVRKVQVQAPPPKPKRQQKQSLILLEEVDILFEEDRPFWSTVFALIVQSRRPIVLTCTDESNLPLSDFVDTACLRLAKQPQDTIIDYALCVAGNEGHLLSRRSVERAVSIREGDLRGTLTELQFWCQIAIGDQKAGVPWFMAASKANAQRTEHGPRLRTVSEDSYCQEGDLFADLDQDRPLLEQQAQQLKEAYEHNGYDGYTIDDELLTNVSTNRPSVLEALNACELRADLLSLTDNLPSIAREGDRVDYTAPLLSDKTAKSFVDTEGAKLLQADFFNDFCEAANDIAFTVRAACGLGDAETAASLEPSTLTKAVLQHGRVAFDKRRHIRTLIEATFEPLSETPESNPWSQHPPGTSVLYGPLAVIVTDVAPMVRAVARSDILLEEGRNRLSSLLTEPGRTGKRQRTTRAARAALEGGNKASTRKERWLPKELDYAAVLRTAGMDWPDSAAVMGSQGPSGYGTRGVTPSTIESRKASPSDSEDELA